MADLKIGKIVLGVCQTNCYFVYVEGTDKALVFDPADKGNYIYDILSEKGFQVAAILLTHGHFDHIGAVNAVRKKYSDIPVYAYKEEKAILEDPVLNESSVMGTEELSLKDISYLDDGAELSLVGETWKLIATPGHTVGSCCYFVESAPVLFSGDTLFSGSCGRTDLATGSMPAIINSIRNVLMKLPDETMVLPGHGPNTSIGIERKQNFIMRM